MSENGPANGQPGKRKRLKRASGQPAAEEVHHVEAGEVVFKGAGGVTASADAQRIYCNQELYTLHHRLQEGDAAKATVAGVRQLVELPPSLSPPPQLKRGLVAKRDDFARQILRELGWGKESPPGGLWILEPEQVGQLWSLSGARASQCPSQDKYDTSWDVRRKELRKAFRRVTGS